MPKFSIKNISISLIIALLIIGITYSTVRFGLSKDNISFPKKDHSHFRIKYIFNGQEENFGSPRYQTDYTKDICNGTLTEAPLHFHDNKTDYQHEHWARMTGGQMLKFYGLNYIGGLNSHMGFVLDKLPQITPVPIHSSSLPQPRNNDKFWIYTGIEKTDNSGNWEIKTKTFEEFVNQDFETFFGKESQERKDIERYGVSYMNFLAPIQAQAHGGIEHKTLNEEQRHILELGEKANTEKLNNQAIDQSTSNLLQSANSITATTASPQLSTSNSPESTNNLTASPNLPQSLTPVLIQSSNIGVSSTKQITENKEIKLFQSDMLKTPNINLNMGEELKSINNFLGDVVIFVQPNSPSLDQVQARFNAMVKLDKSVCGG